MQGEGGSKLQIRCRLILLISEHPIQQGIRKVKSSLLANLRSSQLANYWTVRKCLFSMCFSPFSAIFLHLHPLNTHITPILKKMQSWLGFFVHREGSNFLPELREGRHRLLNWQIQISKYENKSQLSRAIFYFVIWYLLDEVHLYICILCIFVTVFLNVCIFWSASWLYSGAGLLRHQYLMPGRGDKTSRRPLSQILDEHHLHHQSCQYHHQHHCHDQHFQFSILQNDQERLGEVVVGDIRNLTDFFFQLLVWNFQFHRRMVSSDWLRW